jgi:hypothetical protein
VRLGSCDPTAQIFGCDIDPAAFVRLQEEFPSTECSRHFILGNFLEVLPENFSTSAIDVVIGNPPYVSHHNMAPGQREIAQLRAVEGHVTTNRKASLWAYFVIHSLQFLREGGRMAWVLPGSFLYAEYASELRAALGQLFERSLAIKLEQRLFLSEGTEENTVVLLAEGWKSERTSPMRIAHASDLTSLTEIVEKCRSGDSCGVPLVDRYDLLSLSGDASTLVRALSDEDGVHPLSDFVRIRIGIVTGANKFFVLDEATAREKLLPSSVLRPILAKFGEAKGLSLTETDLKEIRQAGRRCLFVDTRAQDAIEGPLKQHLDSFPVEKLNKNKTFAKRPIWHQCDDGLVPDAFFPSMHASGPILVVNGAGITATNSLYRVYSNSGTDELRLKALSVSLLSTFSQLSAEIEGRHYGSGGLKHEPSEVGRIKVILPRSMGGNSVATAFGRIDTLLRNGRRIQAQAEADAFIFRDRSPARRSATIDVLRRALDEARTRRRRPTKSNANIEGQQQEDAA